MHLATGRGRVAALLARILSAAIGLPIVLFLVQRGGLPFLFLVVFVGAVALFEFASMTMPQDHIAQGFVVILGVLLIVVSAFGGVSQAYAVPLLGLVPISVFVFFTFRDGEPRTKVARMGLGTMGVFWVGGLLCSTFALRLLPGGMKWFVWAAFVSWGSDTAAYFVGKSLGRRKLAPSLSPNKTWEGSAGGVVGAVLGVYGLGTLSLVPEVPLWQAGVVTALGAVLGQVGDLAESLLKRASAVKDSGRIMPGHGGILDRIDALLFVTPLLLGYATVVLGHELVWLGAATPGAVWGSN